MNPFLLYMVKAALSLAALYMVYLMFLGRDTMYGRNRFYILLSFFASLIFPLIIIETRQPIDIQFFGKDLTGVIIAENPDLLVNPSTVSSPEGRYRIILNLYFAGLLVFGIKLLGELLSLFFLIVRQKRSENNIIRLKNNRTSGFSAFGYVFIDARLDESAATEIIKHEQKHLEKLHFLDNLLIEILKTIQWFNPFIYLFDRSLREVHEFQADEECLNSGITIRSYQRLLLNQVFKTNIFKSSDSFSNPTIIKKRMIMMTRKRSRALANFKVLMAVPVATFLLISFSTTRELSENSAAFTDYGIGTISFPSLPPPPITVNDQNAANKAVGQNKVPLQKETEPYVVVDKMPMFPGGDEALLKHLNEHTRYPESAIVNGITGRVVIRFCVTKAGSVDKITVLKGIDPLLDAEAKRVVASLPEFIPGYQGGDAVPVWYMVPVTFSLAGNENSPPPPPPPVPTAITTITTSTSIPSLSSSSAKEFKEDLFIAENYPDQGTADKTPFIAAEEMPAFPGGDAALLKYLSRNTRYPGEARASGKEGSVVVRFCVTESGDVDLVSILKGVDPTLDAEAMRVVSSLSGFTPAMQGGKAVPVWYSVPITFTII